MNETVPYEHLNDHLNELRHEHRVCLAIREGEHPTPQSSLSECPNLWPILQKCWVKDPSLRLESKTCLNDMTVLVS